MDIKSLRNNYMNEPTEENRIKMSFALSKRDNRVDTFREREIARRVALKYSLDKQIDIILSGNAEDIASLKAYREKIKAEVDVYIKELESEVEV